MGKNCGFFIDGCTLTVALRVAPRHPYVQTVDEFFPSGILPSLTSDALIVLCPKKRFISEATLHHCATPFSFPSHVPLPN